MEVLELPFVDAQAMRLQFPETFHAPSQEEFEKIQPGDFVKVCLDEPDQGGERFWCLVTSIDIKKGTILAEVNNQLISYDYAIGTKVKIKFYQVYDIF